MHIALANNGYPQIATVEAAGDRRMHAGQITETCRVTDNKTLPQVDHLNNNAVVYRVCFHRGIKKRSKECWMKKYGEELGWFPPQFENS